MTLNRWKSFEAAAAMADGPIVAEKVDGILSAAMEAIADMLPTATPAVLREGAEAARNALETYERLGSVDESSPSFVAGRLASAVDFLGYASFQTADESVLGIARTQPYARILAALTEGPLRSVDLATRLGKDETQMSRWLATLRGSGAIVSHRHGRELVSALSPVGRLVVEAGWQDERRAPLDTCKVVDMAAMRYDLNALPTPAGTIVREVPRISASGG